VKTPPKLPSILALYFQNLGVLIAVLFILFCGLLAIVRYQMQPYFLSKIQEKVRDGIASRISPMTQALIGGSFEEANLYFGRGEFLPEAFSKKLISPTNDSDWTCKGNLKIFTTEPFGEMCQTSDIVSFNFPLTAGDNRLGRIEIAVSTSVSAWPPYRYLENGILIVMIIVLVLCLFLTLRFRKRVAKPMEEMMNDLDQASERDDFDPLLQKLPFREIYNVTSKLACRSSELSDARIELLETKHRAHLGDIASQVFHDIQSPLKAIMNLAEDPHRIAETQRRHLLKSSAQRIEVMTNELLEEHLHKKKESCLTFLSRPMTSIFHEKQMLLESASGLQLELKIPNEAQTYVASIHSYEFSRVLSNLLNNAIEACAGRQDARITMSLEPIKGISSFARIVIEDNGIGMSRELLEKVRQLPESFGKVNGHGLGLRHAQKFMHNMGSWVLIESEAGVGTKIVLAIPLLPKPQWLEDYLQLRTNEKLVVLDDDECVHHLWQERLNGIEVDYLKSSNEFDINFYPPEHYFYLFDFDLGKDQMTGLDLIQKYRLHSRSVLVTGSYDNVELQKKVGETGIKMIPKFLIPLIGVEIGNSITREKSLEDAPDFVLVNDEKLMNDYWCLRAEEEEKKILIVSSENELDLKYLKPSTPIFIHKTLLGLRSGIEVGRALFDKGFHELILTTGDPKASLSDFPLFKRLVGKEFPSV